MIRQSSAASPFYCHHIQRTMTGSWNSRASGAALDDMGQNGQTPLSTVGIQLTAVLFEFDPRLAPSGAFVGKSARHGFCNSDRSNAETRDHSPPRPLC